MVDVELFLGFPVDLAYEKNLQNVSAEIRSLFISDTDSVYLVKIRQKETTYLGKRVGQAIDLDSLLLIQNNILSLLKRLVPRTYSSDSLILFPIKK